ncbi:GNAT family N-acetyltransferase [Chlorogloeopsis sp. ULAP01]|jgi:predicted N-acyltransferase|uniref:GNAT family N-acetyltransferase n=1 Tax=Chlorogloeopsis sp. ULAP01 TaxID=3056483 RepID=UPI0025AA94EE|nr:GNAT family N-acetyltransferase [Chlorogloeopsis sp. ULAP01]MDM9384585.1 GNAT family N-acetyltransferase [Chlorogloeopsis sp. ULAP01]
MTKAIDCLIQAENNYSYKLYNSILDVDLDDWKQVCQTSDSNVYMDIGFLLTIEKTMAGFSKFWYVIFYDQNGNPSACTSLSTFKADLGVVASKSTKEFITHVRRLLPSFLYLNVLFCGLPISIGKNHLIFVENANQELILKLLDSIMNTIVAKEKIKLTIYKEFNSQECNQLDALLQLNYLKAESLPMHSFQAKFANFSEYCAALKSHYRNDIKRSKRKFEKAGLRVVQLKDTEKILQIYTPEIHQLYEAVVQKSENQLETLPISFFRELAIYFPGQLLFTLVYKDDKIVAFNCSICTQSSVHYLFCGLDYSLNAESDLYFNLMYAALDEALKQNVSKIDFGQTADTFKAKLGSYQTPLYMYIKGTGFLLNWIIRKSLNILFPNPALVPSYNIYKQ